MPTLSMSIQGLRRQLLDRGLFVRQTVVAQVEVAVRLVSLRPHRRAAAVAHLDDDETELGQLLLRADRRERCVIASVCGPG